MHKVVVPKQSSAHRFACLALYRALLRQCNRLPPTAPQLTAVKPHILERFHRYKNLQSPSQTVNALKAGYETLDLLHSASQGNHRDVKVIESILLQAKSTKEWKIALQKTLARSQHEKELSCHKKKKAENRRFQDSTALRHPDTTPITSRPRLIISGRRHVPSLVNARGVPFLRIKKPQPKVLSGVIRSKLEKRWKRIERRERLEVEMLFGQDEDTWDRLTMTGQPETEETWAAEIEKALKSVNQLIRTNDAKNLKLAEKMWAVVLAERKLAAEEQTKT